MYSKMAVYVFTGLLAFTALLADAACLAVLAEESSVVCLRACWSKTPRAEAACTAVVSHFHGQLTGHST